MKFLLDAHLPPSLRQVFAEAGHDAIAKPLAKPGGAGRGKKNSEEAQ